MIYWSFCHWKKSCSQIRHCFVMSVVSNQRGKCPLSFELISLIFCTPDSWIIIRNHKKCWPCVHGDRLRGRCSYHWATSLLFWWSWEIWNVSWIGWVPAIHSAVSWQNEKGLFSHFESTAVIISHCIYHTFSPIMLGRCYKTNCSYMYCQTFVDLDNYCVHVSALCVEHLTVRVLWLRKRLIWAMTSRPIQISYCNIDLFPQCNVKKGVSKLVADGAMNLESTTSMHLLLNL